MTTPATCPPARPTALVAREPVDLLAVVPIVLGFAPTESLVMLTFGAPRAFHARVDLPDRPSEILDVVDLLLEPALRHRVPQVVLIGYSADERRARGPVDAARRAFAGAGIEVVEALCADGSRWYPVPRHGRIPDHGVPYDLDAHRFAAQAVLDGRVVHGSREQLRASVESDPDLVAGVVAALAVSVPESQPVLAEGVWARRLVERHTAGRSRPADADLARLLRGMLDLRIRDAAWSTLDRGTARAHEEFWSDVVRRTPAPLVPAPASLLAFAAWQAGHGALAWCALDRVGEVDPDYGLAGLVAHILEHAIPPDVWEQGGFDWTEGVPDG